MCETAAASYHRHDISDRAWNTLAPLLPGGPGKVGRPAQDNRRFSNAAFWVLRAGAPRRDLPRTAATAAPCLARSAIGAERRLGPTAGSAD